MKAAVLSMLLFLSWSGLPLRGDDSLQVEADFEAIRCMTSFGGDVGIAGDTPESVFAFRRLLEMDDAGALFGRLLEEAMPAGQLYALCGLYFADPPAFQRALPRFRESDVDVETVSGCIVFEVKIADLVWSPESRVMRLQPGESPASWLAKQEGKRGFAVDIAGGGLCHRLRGTPRENEESSD